MAEKRMRWGWVGRGGIWSVWMKRNGKVKERVRVDGFWDGRVLMGDCAC